MPKVFVNLLPVFNLMQAVVNVVDIRVSNGQLYETMF
jgi:hypothetical protein